MRYLPPTQQRYIDRRILRSIYTMYRVNALMKTAAWWSKRQPSSMKCSKYKLLTIIYFQVKITGGAKIPGGMPSSLG